MRFVSLLGFAELEHAELVAHKARRQAMPGPAARHQSAPAPGKICLAVGISGTGLGSPRHRKLLNYRDKFNGTGIAGQCLA
jgi:hypothetical protein